MYALLWRSIAAWTCLFSLATVFAWAQSSTGAISGRVLDPTGATAASAEVKLLNQSTQNTRTATTGENGEFLFTDVAPGAYSVAVRLAGFKLLQKTNLN